MKFDDFVSSLTSPAPPAPLSPALKGLWLARNGHWGAAHEVVQNEDDEASAWVHAYLHREEGDESNARYWYARASRTPCSGPLDNEWRAMVKDLLSSATA